MAILNKMRQRFDGFVNALAGIGSLRDIGSHGAWSKSDVPLKEEVDAIYAESAIFAKIIDIYPTAALRKWVDFNHDRSVEINKMVKDLKLKKQLKRAGIKERLHGGCVVHCDVDDGQTHDMPLDLKSVVSFTALEVYEGHRVTPVNPNRAGESDVYELQGENKSMFIHKSRLLLFPGIEVSDDCFGDYPGMCRESVARRIKPSVERYEALQKVVISIIYKILVGVWKMAGLNDMVDREEDDDLKARYEAKLLAVSITNDVVVDGEDEYELLTPNMSGLKEVAAPIQHNLVAVSDVPHTEVFGESPGASLGATGGSQERDLHKKVSGYQEDTYQEPIQQALDMITAVLKTEPVEFTFNPIDAPDLKTIAETHKLQADADCKYIAEGVLLAEEVRDSRFKGGYSQDTQLDDGAYNAEVKMMRETDESTQDPEVS